VDFKACRSAIVKKSVCLKELQEVLRNPDSIEDGKEAPTKQVFSESTTIGIDVGIKDFAVLSNGEKVENPKYLMNSLQRLKVLQKRVSRKVKGSKK
jgi:transposase